MDTYGGKVKLVTLTPPGEDLLPFGDDTRSIAGEDVVLVEYIYREIWNATAQRRASRLFEAAQRAADRFVRRLYAGPLPRQIGNVKAEQKRGVWHFHYLLPYETPEERVWSKTVERYMAQAWKQDQRRWPDEEVRRKLLWREYCDEKPERGFYGFGFVHGGKEQGRTSERAAGYMARNAAGYMAENVAGVGRHYVNAALIRRSGVTMRALRACNWLYVRRNMIANGELDDSWVPTHWSAEWAAEVLRVWQLLQPRIAAAG